MIYKGISTLITTLLFLSLPYISHSTVIYANEDGNWGDNSTWLGGVQPSTNDTVVIDGYHLSLYHDTTVKRLELKNSSGRSASLDLASASDLTVTGNFYMLGESDGDDVHLKCQNFGTIVVQGLTNIQRRSSSTDNSEFQLYLKDLGQIQAQGGLLFEYHDSGPSELANEIRMVGFSKITVTGDTQFYCRGGKKASISIGTNASFIANGNFTAEIFGGEALAVVNDNKFEVLGNVSFNNTGGTDGLYAQLSGATCKISGNMNLNAQSASNTIDVYHNCAAGQLEVGGSLNFNTNFEGNVHMEMGDNTSFELGGNINRSAGYGSMVMSKNASLTFSGSVAQTIPATRPDGNTIDSLFLTNLIFNNTSGVPMTPNGMVYLSRNLELTEGIINTDSDNLFILKDSVGISGGSSSAYINGPIRKMGRTPADSLIFHIGDQGTYAPFEISRVNNSNSDYTIQYLSCPPPIGTLQNGLIRVSELEYWIMTSTPGSDSVDVRLHWGDADNSGINNLGSLVVTYYTPATGWMNIGNGGTSGLAFRGEGGSIINDLSCPPPIGTVMFTYGTLDASNPLPIAMKGLTAFQLDQQIQLNWATESNFDYFEIEHSTDAFNFSRMETVDAKTGPRNLYQIFDGQPIIGANYYRLKMFDPMGEARYSDVATVQFQDERQLEVFPNPVDDQFQLLGVDWQRASTPLAVYQANGQLLYQGELTEDQVNTSLSAKAMNIQQSGMYYVAVQEGDQVRVVPLYKQ